MLMELHWYRARNWVLGVSQINKLEVWALFGAGLVHPFLALQTRSESSLFLLHAHLYHLSPPQVRTQNCLWGSVSADALPRAEWSQFPLPWGWRSEAWWCDPGFQCLLWTDSDPEGDGSWLTSSVSIYTLFPRHPTANGRLSSIWWAESSSERGSNPEWISQQAKPYSPRRGCCGPSGREISASTCLT